MKKRIITFGVIGVVLIAGLYVKWRYDAPIRALEDARTNVRTMVEHGEIKSGDLIFQTSRSRQSKAIQLATGSEYSHCGIIFKEGRSFYVLEAVQPVQRTPLETWIARGQGGTFVIKRLANEALLTSSAIQRLKKVGEGFIGRNYDATFEWSDERIYCSELLWKVYQRAMGIEIGKLEYLGEFDLTHDAVKTKLRERYGAHIPTNETVISPAAIFASDRLKTVTSNK
ncbi:MAG: YiiX family permuted papain-like enzyme [Bacteroidetes bacterium]|nr:YiiX family permuted papain-like enzyme [Bacteroidota bacterium]